MYVLVVVVVMTAVVNDSDFMLEKNPSTTAVFNKEGLIHTLHSCLRPHAYYTANSKLLSIAGSGHSGGVFLVVRVRAFVSTLHPAGGVRLGRD